MSTENVDICNGQNPLEMPMYSSAEASRYLDIPRSTVRNWTRGGKYILTNGDVESFGSIISPAGPRGKLSFFNLVELHVLQALRAKHGVRVNSARQALDFAEKSLGIERLLLSDKLLAGGGDVFTEHYGDLVNLSKHGLVAIKQILRQYLDRVERDSMSVPIRLYPVVSNLVEQNRSVVIDPYISFGLPVLADYGIRTSVIAGRIDSGEEPGEVAYDLDIPEEAVLNALLYERAA